MPDSESVRRVLREAAEFSRRVGASSEAAALEEICDRFGNEAPAYAVLRSKVDEAMSQASLGIGAILLDDLGDPQPGKESLADEHERIWTDFLKVIYPPEWNEMDASEFDGAECLDDPTVSYRGDPNGVRPIVEKSIALVRRYCELIGTGHLEDAYRLTDAGLRERISLQKFAVEHERAANKYGGLVLDFLLRQFAYIYADDVVRKSSNTSKEGWPKLTAKENRRCRVIGFWVRDKAAGTGCAGSLWIAEEDGEYRVAKFDFYKP